jgi:hypothetical protein
MLSTVFLWINAIAYAGLSLLCVIRLRGTAASLGYSSLGPGGVSEFATVYGGLQMGLALFFAVCAMNPALQRSGLLFALCLYIPLAIFRVVSLLAAGGSTVTWSVAALEIALMLASVGLWFAYRPTAL